MENHPGPVVTVGRIEFIDNSVFVRLFEDNLDVLIYKEGHRLDLCIYCLLVAFPAVLCLSDKLNMTLEGSRWAGGPKVQARGLISKSRRPGRVQSTPLSHTILEMTKFVCPVVPAELISLFGKSKTNWFQIEHKDCFCCKPTTVSRRKFPEISEILQRAVMFYIGRWRRVCEIAGPPCSSYSPVSPRTQLTFTCLVPFHWLCGLDN